MEILTVPPEALPAIDWTASFVGAVEDAVQLVGLAENTDAALFEQLSIITASAHDMAEFIDMNRVAMAMQQAGCCDPRMSDMLASFDGRSTADIRGLQTVHDECDDTHEHDDDDEDDEKDTKKRPESRKKRARKTSQWMLSLHEKGS